LPVAAELARTFESRHGIKLLDRPPAPSKWAAGQRLQATPLGSGGAERNADRHLRIIDEELSRYSPALLRASGVRGLVFVQMLSGRGAVGAAFVDFKTGVFYWNLGYDGKDDYLRHVVHHEMFHAIDLQLNGLLAKDDPIWLALNDRKSKYGPGGHIVRENFRADHSDASPGFVSRYATTGAMEDKAEVFAMLMQPDARKWLEGQSERDAVVAAKVKYMREIVTYHDGINPDAQQELELAQFVELIHRDAPHELEKYFKDPANAASLSAKGYANRTPLHRVLMAGVLYAPQTFIFDMRDIPTIDVNAADDFGWRPLHVAAYVPDARSVGALLARGADPGLKDNQGGTPADWARLRGHADVLAAFQKHKRGTWKLTPEERAERAHEQRRQELQREREQERQQQQRQRP
jgi:hypothetical protein